MKFIRILLTTFALSIASSADSFAGNLELIDQLDNGMEVVLDENHSVPMIACNIIIRSGARDETWETWGTAHFLEHLLFNGTSKRTQEEIYSQFDYIGAYHNAHTGSHYVDFMLLTGRDNFLTGFEILTDMIFNSTLPVEKFEKERGIVIEEIARSSSMRMQDNENFYRELFRGTPLSRNVLGSVESIKNLDRDSVMAFYKKWYVPNNMLLYVTGDFEADTLFDRLQEVCKEFKPKELPEHEIIKTPDMISLSNQGIAKRFAEGTQRQLILAWNVPPPGSHNFIESLALEHFLGSRLESKLPTGVKSAVGLTIDPDLAILEVALSTSANGLQAEEMMILVNNAVDKFATNPPTIEEIQSFASNYRADRIYNSERLHYFGIMYARYWALVSWDEFSSWPERLDKIQPERISSAAERLLSSDKSFAMSFEPDESNSLGNTELRGHGGMLVMPVTGGEKKSYQTDKREDRSTIPVENESVLTKKVADPGYPTIIVREDPSARVCAVHVLVKDRWKFDVKFGAGSVDLLHQLLIADPSWEPLKKLDHISARLKCVDSPGIPYDNYYSIPDFSFVRLEMLPDTWQEGIGNLGDIFSKPAMNEANLLSAKTAASIAAEANSRSSIKKARNALRQKLISDTPLSATIYGEVSQLSIKNIKSLRREYFDPENLIISVAGPIEGDQIIKALKKRFSYGKRNVVVNAAPLTMPSRSSSVFNDTLETDAAQGALVWGQVLGEVNQAERAALSIANSFLNERLSFVLREERGLAYTLGSRITVRPDANGGAWAFWELSIGTRSENLEAASDGFKEVLKKFREYELSRNEILKLANASAGRMMMRDMSRIGQAFNMCIGEFYWEDPEHYRKLAAALGQVSPAEVEAVKRRYMMSDAFSSVAVR